MSEYTEAISSIYFTMHNRVKPKTLGHCEDKNLEVLEELAERATPKKPDVNINNGYCPNCHQAFGLERTRQAMIRPYWLSFCPCCGQALDWSK
nr:MAG TPA: Transcription initiation factor IIE, alpha FINGER, Transcription [Caudoviricetes sp.]